MITGDDDIFEGDADLAAFLNPIETEKETSSFVDNDLFAFLNDEKTPTDTQEEPSLVDDDLFAFLNDQEDTPPKAAEEEEVGGIFGDILEGVSGKPEPILPFKHEKRKARLDITKNSSEDHRTVKRYTKKEINDQLIKDYRYMMAKGYMMIQPVTVMEKYPYKKKKSNSDIIKARNVDEDYVLVIGKLQKWRGTEEFKGKAYKLGSIMYVRKGDYWVNGKIMAMAPHFAIVIHKSYKRIKSKRIRDCLAPLKQRLRTGKPFSIYKEFPILVKRTGYYS